MDLSAKVKAIAHQFKPRETREQVINYFKAEYPGEKVLKNGSIRYEWKEQLTSMLEAFTVDAKGKPYKRASIARRFQKDTKTGKDRYESTQPNAKQKAEYKAIGALLPKADGLSVYGKLYIQYSQTCEEREIDIVLEGDALKAFLENPSFELLVNVYQDDDYDTEDGFKPCNMSENDLNFNVLTTNDESEDTGEE